jgi:hypothetical protein
MADTSGSSIGGQGGLLGKFFIDEAVAMRPDAVFRNAAQSARRFGGLCFQLPKRRLDKIVHVVKGAGAAGVRHVLRDGHNDLVVHAPTVPVGRYAQLFVQIFGKPQVVLDNVFFAHAVSVGNFWKNNTILGLLGLTKSFNGIIIGLWQ